MCFVSPKLTSSVSYSKLIWDHVFIPSRNCPLTMFNENQNYSKRTLLLLIKIYMKVQYVTILMWQKMTAGEYNTVHGIHLEKCMMIVKENWEWNTWWRDGWMEMGGWMDGWTNGLLDGRINGWPHHTTTQPHHTTTQLSIYLPGPDTAWT